MIVPVLERRLILDQFFSFNLKSPESFDQDYNINTRLTLDAIVYPDLLWQFNSQLQFF